MAYNVNSLTDDCYPNTLCLINKFDIRDEEQLSAIEADITFAKSSEWERNPLLESFDFNHYKAIHKFLFEDLYSWAGELRSIDISKKGTSFCSAYNLEEMCRKSFDYLKSKHLFINLDKIEFVDEMVDFYCTTNMLHPFRDGNGRTQRLFISQLIRHNGYDFNFSDIDTDELMIATIHSANGVTDFLRDIFLKNIR